MDERGRGAASTFARTLTFDPADPKLLTGMQKLAQTQGSGGLTGSAGDLRMEDGLGTTAYRLKKIRCMKPEKLSQFPSNPKQAY